MSHYWSEWGENGDGVSWLVQWDIRSVCCLKIGGEVVSWLYTHTHTHPCSLVVQLVRDLQGDLYPYFGLTSHHTSPHHTSPHHTSPHHTYPHISSPHITITFCIQWVFTTLAYLFKFLWRHMVKEVAAVYMME